MVLLNLVMRMEGTTAWGVMACEVGARGAGAVVMARAQVKAQLVARLGARKVAQWAAQAVLPTASPGQMVLSVGMVSAVVITRVMGTTSRLMAEAAAVYSEGMPNTLHKTPATWRTCARSQAFQDT